MGLCRIKKRDGSVVDFDRSKIERAIRLASEASGHVDITWIKPLVDSLLPSLEQEYGYRVPTVENIQDMVERFLMSWGHESIAKHYIIYREKRSEARQDRKVMVDVKDTMEEYLQHVDWRINENANIAYSIGGLILKNSEKITANYWLSHIYPEHIGQAHRNGDYHIHDLGMFTPYCAGWSLRALLEEGFNGVPNKVESTPPKHLNSAVNQMVNFFGVLQNEWAGAQAFSSFDTYLAPFVHKYSEEVREELRDLGVYFSSDEEQESFVEKKTYRYVVQCMQNFIFGLNTPSRWGTQTPFTNITLDWECPRDLRDKRLMMGGTGTAGYCKRFGELEQEMRILNRALIQVYTDGDMNGRIFTFPIPTYNITEDFDWEDDDVTALFEMTAKYGIPYFQNFVGSQYMLDEKGEKVKNPKAYKPDDVRSMCCRLQLDLEELKKRGGGLFGSAEMTGSVGVVTLNLARVGYLFAGDMDGMKEHILSLMELAKQSLELKRKEVTKRLESGFYPYTKRYLGSFRNHFSTIGLNGMNEAVLNFSRGQFDLTMAEGQELAHHILDHMRDVLTDFQEETGHMYNLEASPAEGASYRFAKVDKKQFTDIIQAGTEDAPYYTNSSWLPVGYTDDAFEALSLQDNLQCQYTGGTVLHLYLGERITDSESCKLLVKKALGNFRLPYISITPTFSICPKHGYLVGEHDFCPQCDQEVGYVGEKYDIDLRKVYTADQSKLERIEKEHVGQRTT